MKDHPLGSLWSVQTGDATALWRTDECEAPIYWLRKGDTFTILEGDKNIRKTGGTGFEAYVTTFDITKILTQHGITGFIRSEHFSWRTMVRVDE